MNEHHINMQRCLSLARKGLGHVAPNPMVGCVIVHKGNIIGEGYHRKYGEAHAEVNAVNAVKDKSLLAEATVYVNLEPCSHFGKTPPCADLLIKHQVKEVIIANADPNPMVAGKGIEKLKNAGINVITGVLEDEAKLLNNRFFCFFNQKRPYIILKWAKTLDGFMDIERSEPDHNLKYWITNDELKTMVHKWRTEEDAILVGTNTALNDNPQLNIRYWQGKQPLRLVLDEELSLPTNLHLFDQQYPTVVFTSTQTTDKPNLSYIKIDFSHQLLQQLLDYLYKLNISSLIVEGGKELLLTFINEGLWDEARILTGKKKFINGLLAPEIEGEIIYEAAINGDHIRIIQNNNKR
ncbi:MAG: bifunctional diaminohydroxyphosphoribosylaminopyrimidine deaminase/5-amino-6-(5-phosphoribosylamino)uracil reductase RibD [Bacteroidetes bacterium]|nr:bifunctional diaminohydroxyphosphoribosylaminopyrimidine deaminase/5-amino-6-(5-phosphoribosylamino)uracil reductase RibD [Bacteroidota bacterium]